MARTEWSDTDKAAAYVVWISNEKNTTRTARDTGVPHGTLRYWVKDWEQSGPPEHIMDHVQAQAYEFVHHASSIREKAMTKLEELIPQAEVKQLSAIATVVGIMDDKIRLANGLATKRTETVHKLPSKQEMKELMSGFADSLVVAAEDRAAETVQIEAESVIVE